MPLTLKLQLFRASTDSFRPSIASPVFLALVVKELVSAIKSPKPKTVAPRNVAGVLRDAMLLAMSSEVTRAGEHFSTSSVAADMRVSIDVGTSRCNPSGNVARHRRRSDHAVSMGRQCRGGRHAGSGGKRKLIVACHSLLRIDGSQIIPLSIWSGVDEGITEAIVDTNVRKLEGWIRLTVSDGIRIHGRIVGPAASGGEGAWCHITQAVRRKGDIGIPSIIGSAR
jgi:hypothetical protein